jgi:hypothetical protein
MKNKRVFSRVLLAVTGALFMLNIVGCDNATAPTTTTQYTVTFNPDGGAVNPTSVRINSGNPAGDQGSLFWTDSELATDDGPWVILEYNEYHYVEGGASNTNQVRLIEKAGGEHGKRWGNDTPNNDQEPLSLRIDGITSGITDGEPIMVFLYSNPGSNNMGTPDGIGGATVSGGTVTITFKVPEPNGSGGYQETNLDFTTVGDYCIRIRDNHSPNHWLYTDGAETNTFTAFNQLPKTAFSGTTAVVTFDKFKPYVN